MKDPSCFLFGTTQRGGNWIGLIMAGGNGGNVAVVNMVRRFWLATTVLNAMGARGVSFVAVVLKNRT